MEKHVAMAAPDCQHVALGCGTQTLPPLLWRAVFHSRMPDRVVRARARALRRHKDADAHFVLLIALEERTFVDNGRAAGVDNGCAAGIDRPQMRSVGTPALGPCRALGGKLVPVLLGWRHFLMGTRVRPLSCHPSQDHTN